jgi:AraC-like DNA-binding protein
MHLSYFSRPSAGARRYVRYYIQREAQLGASTVTMAVPARAAHLLTFAFGTPFETRAADTGVIRRPDVASLVGLETCRRHYLISKGNMDNFVIHFQPAAIHQLFGVPGSEIADCDYAAHAVLGSAASEFRQRLGNARSFQERVRIADQFIVSQDLSRPVRDSIELAANEIMHNDGRTRIDLLARQTGLSIRKFQTMFRERVGVSPKVYSRIVRFEATLNTKAASPHISWLTIAHEFGYHDQMHLIHDFRHLSGDTPSGLLNQTGFVLSDLHHAADVVHMDGRSRELPGPGDRGAEQIR